MPGECPWSGCDGLAESAAHEKDSALPAALQHQPGAREGWREPAPRSPHPRVITPDCYGPTTRSWGGSGLLHLVHGARAVRPAALILPATSQRAGLAQLVEHPPCKRKVVRSIRTAGTTRASLATSPSLPFGSASALRGTKRQRLSEAGRRYEDPDGSPGSRLGRRAAQGGTLRKRRTTAGNPCCGLHDPRDTSGYCCGLRLARTTNPRFALIPVSARRNATCLQLMTLHQDARPRSAPVRSTSRCVRGRRGACSGRHAGPRDGPASAQLQHRSR